MVRKMGIILKNYRVNPFIQAGKNLELVCLNEKKGNRRGYRKNI